MADVDLWFRNYPKENAIDTAHMSDAELAAWHRLRDYAWPNDCKVPADDERLARIAKMPLVQWHEVRPVVLRAGFEAVGDWFVYRKHVPELEWARRNAEAKRRAGKKGADSRWHPDGNSHATANGKRMAGASESQWQTNGPSPSPDSSSFEELSIATTNAKGSSTGNRRRASRSTEPVGFGDFYESYPRKKNRPAALHAYEAALSRGASPEMLKIAAERFAVTRRNEDPKFTPYPATWLNADAWMDPQEQHEHGSNRPTSHSKPAIGGFAAAVAARVDDRAGADVVALRDRARDLAPPAECGLQDDPGGDIEDRETDQSQRVRQGVA
jgi:uncharacterized protein YdaU (DUF1376 family)